MEDSSSPNYAKLEVANDRLERSKNLMSGLDELRKYGLDRTREGVKLGIKKECECMHTQV